MRKSIIRGALLSILLLGFTIPGVALAGGGEKGCSNIGTWFGVVAPGDSTLTGWMGTVTGKSSNEGSNNIEFANFDATLGLDFYPFNAAVGITSLHGNWVRTGGDTFDYTFTGYALDENNTPLYIAKVSGHVTLIMGCQYEHITATLEVFAWGVSPFDGEPMLAPIPLDDHYGYRATVDLPY